MELFTDGYTGSYDGEYLSLNRTEVNAFRLKIHRFLGSLAGIIYAANVKFKETADGSRIFHVEVSGTAKVAGGTHTFVV